MKTKTQTSETMFKSKVDIDTSDIFFNFGAVTYNEKVRESNKKGYFFDADYYLKQDAENFLNIIHRPNITPQDLVDDFLYSRL
jgi:hypothetical protein